jgi:hypothetical protein
MAELLHPHQKATQSSFWQGTVLAGDARASRPLPGLVSSKTKANESDKSRPPIGENDFFDITFSKTEQAKNRVKRLKRAVWASGHLHGIAKKGHRPLQPWFVTLTYAQAGVWLPNHVKRAMDRFRAWCTRKGYSAKYTWVSEIQPKRLERTGEAVVHYHLLIWLPIGVQMPHWDRSEITPSGRERKPFWTHGMTNTQKAKAGVGYLMKYLSKLGELTVFPEGLRLYGIGGLDESARAVRGWYNLPEWVKCTYGVGDVKRMGSHLVDMQTGEVLPPMFSSQFIPGGIRLRCLRDYPQRWHSGAYSTFKGVKND